MITINNYLHRNDLYDITRRWMYGDLHPADADSIVRLVHFNNVYVSRSLKLFSERIFRELHKCDLDTRTTSLKGDLKDTIINNPPYRNMRMDELIKHYHANPGRYYRETPFHATLFFKRSNGAEEYIGSSRIKRVRRLAEKSARKIIDGIYDSIMKRADSLSYDRAERLGIPHEFLLTSQEEMYEEFLKAEERLLQDLKNNRDIPDADNRVINDVAGMKVILEDGEQGQLLALLKAIEGCEIIEEERHRGRYNATNLIVGFTPPAELILQRPLTEKIINSMQARGLSPEAANRSYVEFVRSGEQRVYLEIIISNYEEMIESEIGRCMHEDRIIEQRLSQKYWGHLAKNIEYLMEYLFTFPFSAQVALTVLPIKLWNRYLPDYFDDVLRTLFQIPQISILDE